MNFKSAPPPPPPPPSQVKERAPEANRPACFCSCLPRGKTLYPWKQIQSLKQSKNPAINTTPFVQAVNFLTDLQLFQSPTSTRRWYQARLLRAVTRSSLSCNQSSGTLTRGYRLSLFYLKIFNFPLTFHRFLTISLLLFAPTYTVRKSHSSNRCALPTTILPWWRHFFSRLWLIALSFPFFLSFISRFVTFRFSRATWSDALSFFITFFRCVLTVVVFVVIVI